MVINSDYININIYLFAKVLNYTELFLLKFFNKRCVTGKMKVFNLSKVTIYLIVEINKGSMKVFLSAIIIVSQMLSVRLTMTLL